MSKTGLYTLRIVPEIVDEAVEGVEQVFVEVVEGSKRVIRAISIRVHDHSYDRYVLGRVFVLRVVYERTPRLIIFQKPEKRSTDASAFKYGGRLKEG